MAEPKLDDCPFCVQAANNLFSGVTPLDQLWFRCGQCFRRWQWSGPQAGEWVFKGAMLTNLFPDVCIYCGKDPCEHSTPECGPRQMETKRIPQERLDRHEYFAEITRLTAERSTCLRGHVGAIAVQDRRIVATGYNGAPPRASHCIDVGCDIPEDNPDAGCQRTIHAEANLVAWAARAGVPLQGSSVWSTHAPCAKCAQLLVAAGIESFTFLKPYRLGRTDILLASGVIVYKYPNTWGEESSHSGVAR